MGRDQNQIPRKRLARDQRVVFTDPRALPLQLRTNLPGSQRIPLGVVEDWTA